MVLVQLLSHVEKTKHFPYIILYIKPNGSHGSKTEMQKERKKKEPWKY